MIQNPQSKSGAERVPPKAFVFNPKLVVTSSPGGGAGWLWALHRHPDFTTGDDPTRPALRGPPCSRLRERPSLVTSLSCYGAGWAGVTV